MRKAGSHAGDSQAGKYDLVLRKRRTASHVGELRDVLQKGKERGVRRAEMESREIKLQDVLKVEMEKVVCRK